MRNAVSCLGLILWTLAWANHGTAALTAIRVVDRTDVLAGQSFGAAGPYERIVARAHFALDPDAPANRNVRDLRYAPRNAQGRVEFAADLYVLKPRDSSQGNRTILFEVSNRGGKSLLGNFNFARGSADPRSPEEFGDGLLMREGFTLVWLGWQYDLPPAPQLLHIDRIVARKPEGPLTGPTRAEFVPDEARRSFPLADRTMMPIPVLESAMDRAVLTVRDRAEGARQVVPRAEWQFAREQNGAPVPDQGHVYMSKGLQPGRIYELVYEAQEPAVAGIGPAGIRDLVSFLKYGGKETLLGDQARFQMKALGFGTSQSGRFLRAFVSQGFNADEQGRTVFDGVWANVAGAGVGSFNDRFAQPSRDAAPFLNFFFPVDLFPFTDLPETDPLTHRTAGRMDAVLASGKLPKMFYTNGSYEYWGRAAGLIHTTPDGKADAPLPPETRVYYITGAQHFPGRLPVDRSVAQHPENPANQFYLHRALLMAFQRWIQQGKEPPPSHYPRVNKDELTVPAQLSWPRVPGVIPPARPHFAYRVDYGPEYSKDGVVAEEPPRVGRPYPLMVPQVDEFGNEKGGIRLPEISVPLGTYTGWNLRKPGTGASDEMISFYGSYFPLPATKEEARRLKDTRPARGSLYRDERDYLAQLQAAAEQLVRQGLLLPQDLPALQERGKKLWANAMEAPQQARE